MQAPTLPESNPSIALFATCLVNNFYPKTGIASAKILQIAGFQVSVPASQTCCGQPNYNNGDPQSAVSAAKQFIKTFEGFDVIVVPSSSCAGMIINHYPKLLESDTEWSPKAKELANRTWEIVDFLTDRALNRLPINLNYKESLCHHHSCSSLREVKATHQINQLLNHCLPNVTLTPLKEPETCCGFGGAFSAKLPDIANKLAHNKLKDITDTGTHRCTMLDSGCKWHLQNNNDQQDLHLEHFLEFLYRAMENQ